MLGELTVRVERGEDGFYVAEVLELPGCFTQADSLRDLFVRVGEAVEAYLEVRSGG